MFGIGVTDQNLPLQTSSIQNIKVNVSAVVQLFVLKQHIYIIIINYYQHNAMYCTSSINLIGIQFDNQERGTEFRCCSADVLFYTLTLNQEHLKHCNVCEGHTSGGPPPERLEFSRFSFLPPGEFKEVVTYTFTHLNT